MKVRKGEIEIDRFVVPFRAYGEASQFIVCVNGAQQTMAAWKSVLSVFSKEYTVVLFDFPGQGRARILYGPTAISVDEQIRILREVVSAQNASGKVNVFGASWGGVIVAAFASQYPELVEKIILGSFGLKTSKKMLIVLKKGQELFENGKGDAVADLIINNFGQHLTEFYKKKIYSQFQRIKNENLRAFYLHGKLLASGQNINQVVNLCDIKAKTLIINGEFDTIMDLEDVRVASEQIPNCETRIIEGVGHFLHNERKDILGIYKDFLSGKQERSHSTVT